MNESNFLSNLRKRLENATSTGDSGLISNEINSILTITAKYSTLYEVGKLVGSEMDLDALLRIAMDKVVEVTRAQRGFIALVHAESQLDFKVARNMEKADIDQPEFEVSRSIIERVLAGGETICLPDAMADATFGGVESVMRLQLLSVLCTPVKIDDKVADLIYVDNSDVKNLFDDTVADLLIAFSEQMAIAMQNAHRFSDLKKSNQQLSTEQRSKYRFEAIIGSAPSMTEVLELVADVADTDATVLIQGESGTGKELIAKTLHFNSGRRECPFVTVHSGAIPESLIESELFGHVKGAFTGAFGNKKGKFELAHTGSIFLDEIGEMNPALQVKLLRVLEDGSYSPLGGESEKQCDVRVIAATNRDLNKMISEGTFREDLFYRLNVINLVMPSLRDRREDILLLVDHFIQKYSGGDRRPRLTRAVEQSLMEFDYPGNVRQLENIIRRAVILCKGGTIELRHLPKEIDGAGSSGGALEAVQTFQERKQHVIKQFEQDELRKILVQTGGGVRKSARVAGMDVKNFSEKLKKYGIKAEDYKK